MDDSNKQDALTNEQGDNTIKESSPLASALFCHLQKYYPNRENKISKISILSQRDLLTEGAD